LIAVLLKPTNAIFKLIEVRQMPLAPSSTIEHPER